MQRFRFLVEIGIFFSGGNWHVFFFFVEIGVFFFLSKF